MVHEAPLSPAIDGVAEVEVGACPLGSKFWGDVLSNLVALAVVAGTAVCLNAVIGRCYDASSLGVFNQVYALYIVFSQFGALGVHWSTLKYTAEHVADRNACASIVLAGLLLAAAIGGLFSLLFVGVRGIAARLLDSPQVSEAMAWAVLGLYCFCLNKVLLGALNGLGRLRAYAFFSGLRPVVMLSAVFGMAVVGCPGVRLPAIFSITEAFVLAGLLVAIAGHLRGATRTGVSRWAAEHLDFGARSMASGVLTELGTRVDILILGLLSTDAVVGIYSFAAIVAEGLGQIPVVFRVTLNPTLARLIAERRCAELSQVARQGKRASMAVVAPVGVAAILLYPVCCRWMGVGPEFSQGWAPFAILVGGIVVTAGYLPFGQILLQAGRPATQSWVTLVVVAANAAGNFALVPILGAAGSALATSGSLVVSVFLINEIFRRDTGVSLWRS